MFKLDYPHKIDESVSSLYNNLDVLIEKANVKDEDIERFSFVTVSKANVNILHTFKGRESVISKVLEENSVNKSYVLQAKFCVMGEDEVVLVVTTYKGVLIFDGEGQLLLFWHNLRDDGVTDSSTFCRGIACVLQKYICVGTSSGKILVLNQHKNTYTISHKLKNHTHAISAMTGLGFKSKTTVDFVSADDSGLLCTYKSGNKFTFVSHLIAKDEKMPCTSMKFIPENVVAAGYMSGMIRLFDVKKATLLAEICAHARAVACMDVTTMPISGPFYLFSGSEDSFIRVWKITNEKELSIQQVWFFHLKDLLICGIRCDRYGTMFAMTAYDKSQIFNFSRA